MSGPISTSTTNFSDTITNLIDRRVQANVRPKLVWVQQDNIETARHQPGTGKVFVFNAIGDLTDSSTALTEGTPPTADTLAFANDQITAAQYGRTISMTDLAILESPNELIEVAAERIARSAAERAERVTLKAWNDFTGTVGHDLLYSGTATSRATVSAKLTGSEVDLAVALLKARGVDPFPDGFYHGVIAARTEYDVKQDSGWLSRMQYAAPTKFLNGEVGAFGGVRFVVAGFPVVYGGDGASSVDVCRTVIMGQGAQGFGDMQTIGAYVTMPGGHGDPLAQQAIVGWKATFGAGILKAADSYAKAVMIEHAATIVSSGDA